MTCEERANDLMLRVVCSCGAVMWVPWGNLMVDPNNGRLLIPVNALAAWDRRAMCPSCGGTDLGVELRLARPEDL